jgi:NAD(P)-dependent dehydrogenase (short-subunit alcohol dehydrogenase family)
VKLAGKVAIVTGAASGIGRGIALALGAEGARVAVVDVDEAGAKSTVSSLSGEGRVYGADITNKRAIDDVVADVVASWGGVHVLVNNAGVANDGALWRLSDEAWHEVLELDRATDAARERARRALEGALQRM